MNRKNISVEENLNLVYDAIQAIAKRLPPNISKEELIGCGVIGLYKAVNKFDSNRGVQFSTYADIKIKGAIRDELRNRDPTPRTSKRDANQIENVSHILSQKLEREPYSNEVAGWLEIKDIERYHQMAARAESLNFFNIDEFMLMSKPILKESLEKISNSESIHEKLRKKELVNIVRNYVSKLPEQQQKVFSLYYQDELTLKEIAKIMNLTESRISQIHKKGSIKLRDKIRIFHKEIFNENYIPKQTSQK